MAGWRASERENADARLMLDAGTRGLGLRLRLRLGLALRLRLGLGLGLRLLLIAHHSGSSRESGHAFEVSRTVSLHGQFCSHSVLNFVYILSSFKIDEASDLMGWMFVVAPLRDSLYWTLDCADQQHMQLQMQANRTELAVALVVVALVVVAHARRMDKHTDERTQQWRPPMQRKSQSI